MHILFLTLVEFKSPIATGLYPDLLKAFIKEGHKVTVICPNERRNKQRSKGFEEEGIRVIPVRSLNLQKTNSIEKGLATISIHQLFIKKIKSKCKRDKFDLVLYSTPPITFAPVVSFVKKKYNSKAYLLLKDIFPQNAVDLGMLKANGILHKWFASMEKRLYAISDHIGCMSPANLRYVRENHPEFASKLEVNPNTINVRETFKASTSPSIDSVNNSLPKDKKIVFFGGNLGQPQAIPDLLETIRKSCEHIPLLYYVIAGDGTYATEVDEFFKINPQYGRYFGRIDSKEFEELVLHSHICLIHLSELFTIPNFPSRILTYMLCGKPILAAVDSFTDVGETVVKGNFGFSCRTTDRKALIEILEKVANNHYDLEAMGKEAFNYLKSEFDVTRSVNLIVDKVE